MYWPVLSGLLLALAVAVHLWWRRNFDILRRQMEAQAGLQPAPNPGPAGLPQPQAIAQIQAQQQAVFNSMVEGVLVLDGANRVQLVNQSLQRLFSLGDVRGQTILEAFRLPELASLVQRLQDERTLQGVAFELPGVDERWVEINAAAVTDAAGVAHGAIFVFHDLTRVKQLERTRQ